MAQPQYADRSPRDSSPGSNSHSEEYKSSLELETYSEKENLLEEGHSLEAQHTASETILPAEQRTSTKTKFLFLGIYFLLNLGLTISNKAVLSKVSLALENAEISA